MRLFSSFVLVYDRDDVETLLETIKDIHIRQIWNGHASNWKKIVKHSTTSSGLEIALKRLHRYTCLIELLRTDLINEGFLELVRVGIREWQLTLLISDRHELQFAIDIHYFFRFFSSLFGMGVSQDVSV